MSQELIETAARALLERAQSDVVTPAELSGDMAEMCRELAHVAVAAIHPTVSSVEELGALPEGSVIRFIDITPTVAVKDDEGTWCGSHGLNYYGWDDDDPSPVPFPATVLYTPGGAA